MGQALETKQVQAPESQPGQGTESKQVQAPESQPGEVPDFASEMLHSDMDGIGPDGKPTGQRATLIALSTKVAAADPLTSDIAPVELADQSGRAFEYIAAPAEFANQSEQASEHIQEPFSDIATLFEQAPYRAIPLENLVAEEESEAMVTVSYVPTACQDKAINTTVTEVLEASTNASDLMFVPEQSATQLNSRENFDANNLEVQK